MEAPAPSSVLGWFRAQRHQHEPLTARQLREARQLWQEYWQGPACAKDDKTKRVTGLENFIEETLNNGRQADCTVAHSLSKLDPYDESVRIRKLLKIVASFDVKPLSEKQRVSRIVTAVWGETQGLFSHAQMIREKAKAVSIKKQFGQIQWEEHPSSARTDPCVFFFRMGERLSDSHMQRIVKFCTGDGVPSVTRASLLCSCARTVRPAQLRRAHGS
jgi:hypothetical protein